MRLSRRGSNVVGAVAPHFSIAGTPWSPSILATPNQDRHSRWLRLTRSPASGRADHASCLSSAPAAGSLVLPRAAQLGHLVGTGKVSFAPKGAGPVACEITKPCRLWDGGSVSGWMKSLAAWLAPQVPNFPAWYGSSPKRQAEAGLAPFTVCSGLHPDRAVSFRVITLAWWGHLADAEIVQASKPDLMLPICYLTFSGGRIGYRKLLI